MSSSDVRSILDLPSRQDHASSSTSQQDPPRRAVSTAKKPDGISRELYALIGDNAPFLAETQAALSATKYRERPKPKIKDARWYAVSLKRSCCQLNL
jgi:DNA methyltransferase 1-associated protein 1